MAAVKSAATKSANKQVSVYVRYDSYYGLTVFDAAKAETVTVTKTNSAGKVISKTTESLSPQRLVNGLCDRAKSLLGVTTKGKYRLDITVVPLK